MHKRFKDSPELPATDLGSPGDHLSAKIVQEFRKYSMAGNRMVMGEFAIETENPEGLHVLYQCFPSGDFFLWFIENGFFTLIALVGEKMKTLCRMPVQNYEEFTTQLDIVVTGMCAKNGYIPKTNERKETKDNPPEQE